MKTKITFALGGLMTIALWGFCRFWLLGQPMHATTLTSVLCAAYFLIMILLLSLALVFSLAKEWRREKTTAYSLISLLTCSNTLIRWGVAAFFWEFIFLYSLFKLPWSYFAVYYIYQTVMCILLLLLALGTLVKAILLIKSHRQLGQRVFLNPKTYLIIGLFLFTFAITYLFFAMFHWNADLPLPYAVLQVIYAVYPYAMGAFFLLALVMAVIKAIRTSKRKANPV